MKKIIILFVVRLLIQQVVRAQGTVTYLSNLEQSSTGSQVVGNDSRIGVLFFTGNNPGGYALDSVQLAMTDASGNPSGFTVMIYTDVGSVGPAPGSSLGMLSGSLNPATAGIYTYTAAANFILSANTSYFIILTSGTTIANGAYGLSLAGANFYNPNGGWLVLESPVAYDSSNGSSWNTISGAYPQFALTATAVPEPSSGILFGFGGLFLLAISFHRRSLKIS